LFQGRYLPQNNIRFWEGTPHHDATQNPVSHRPGDHRRPGRAQANETGGPARLRTVLLAEQPRRRHRTDPRRRPAFERHRLQSPVQAPQVRGAQQPMGRSRCCAGSKSPAQALPRSHGKRSGEGSQPGLRKADAPASSLGDVARSHEWPIFERPLPSPGLASRTHGGALRGQNLGQRRPGTGVLAT